MQENVNFKYVVPRGEFGHVTLAWLVVLLFFALFSYLLIKGLIGGEEFRYRGKHRWLNELEYMPNPGYLLAGLAAFFGYLILRVAKLVVQSFSGHLEIFENNNELVVNYVYFPQIIKISKTSKAKTDHPKYAKGIIFVENHLGKFEKISIGRGNFSSDFVDKFNSRIF